MKKLFPKLDIPGLRNQKIRIIVFQTGWQTFAKIFSAISTLLLIGLINRIYGGVGVGVFTLASIYLGFFYLAADLGLNGYILNRLDEEKTIFSKLITFRFLWAVILGILSIVLLPFMPFYSFGLWLSVIIGSFSIVANSFFTSLNVLNQKNQRYNNATISSAVGSVVTLITGLLLVFFDSPIQYFTLSVSLGWIANSLVGFWLLRKLLSGSLINVDFSYILSLLKRAWPVSATLLINTFYFRVDAFILSSFHSIADVGIYNLAYTFFQDVLVVPTFIMNSYYPMMVAHFKANIVLFLNDLRKASFLMAGMGIFAGIAGFFLSPSVIWLVGGDSVSDSGSILQILSVSLPAFFLSALFIWTFMTVELYKKMLGIYFAGLIINVVLNAVFIPIYSYWAAAWITVLSEYLILLLQVIILIPTFKKLINSKA